MIDIAITTLDSKWPFTLTTDSGEVKLNREEVWKLTFLCWAVLHESDLQLKKASQQ